MPDIQKDYRTANRDAKKAFEDKYGNSIKTSTDDILDRYGIDENSKLAKIVETALRKFLLALDERTGAYKTWYGANADNLTALNAVFGKTMHSNSFLMIRSRGSQIINWPHFKDLMKIDMGRSMVVIHTNKLIYQYQDEITDSIKKRKSNPAQELLGSIIRQAINTYYKNNNDDVKVTFSNSPKETSKRLQTYLQQVK